MHLEQFREPQEKLWNIAENGLLVRKVRDGEPAWQDSLELSGLSMSVYASYGVTCGGRLSFSWTGTWIALRTIPVETCSATFQAASSLEELPSFTADGAKVTEFPREFRFDGILHIVSMTPEGERTAQRGGCNQGLLRCQERCIQPQEPYSGLPSYRG